MAAQVPRTYVPGQDVALDKLVQTYDAVSGSPLAERDEREERSIEDPFGIKGEGTPDGREGAKRMVDKLLRLAGLLLAENGVVEPADQMFAYELFSLNVINSKDCPLKPAEVDRVRREAFEYYDKGIKAAQG